MSRYANRREAGRLLGRALRRFKGQKAVVLALPRGGVVLGAEVAKELNAAFGLVLVRKIGHPAFPEYAIGAVAEKEKPLYNPSELALVDKQWLKKAEAEAYALIELRRRLYFGKGYSPTALKGKTVIVVDDGIATGLTMLAAIKAVRSHHPKRLVVAVPVASPKSVDELNKDVRSAADTKFRQGCLLAVAVFIY